MPPRPVRRQVGYDWRLRELMAARGLFKPTDLEPLLAERGITLSSVQVWRLVTQVPERLSLTVLAALCDILEATPADLIVTRSESAAALPPAAAGNGPADPAALKPRRATLKPPSYPGNLRIAGAYDNQPPAAYVRRRWTPTRPALATVRDTTPGIRITRIRKPASTA